MAQNKIFLLIGSEDAGKTGTIDEWCKLKGKERKETGLTTFIVEINGKDEFVVISSCSPQELEGYNLENIRKLISERIERYRKMAEKKGFERFIWIMATTVGITQNSIKIEEVRQAIDLLKEERFSVIKIYVKREGVEKFEEIDNFVNQIKDEEILSVNDCTRQAKELDDIIIKSV